MDRPSTHVITGRIRSMRSSAGFSMIEVVVVVLLVALLATFLLPRYTKIVEEGKSKEAIAMLHLIRAGEEVYFSQFRVFSDVFTMLNIEDPTDRPLAENDWEYTLSSADFSLDFTAEAERTRGPNQGDTYVITGTGDVTGP